MSLKDFISSIRHIIEENKDISQANKLAKEIINDVLKEEEQSTQVQADHLLNFDEVKDNFNEIIQILNDPNEQLAFIQNTLFLIIFEYLELQRDLDTNINYVTNLLSVIANRIKKASRESLLQSFEAFKLYRIVVEKFYKKCEEFNDSHKKFKQKIHEEAKNLPKFFETLALCLDIQLDLRSKQNLKELLNDVIFLLYFAPNILKNVNKAIDDFGFKIVNQDIDPELTELALQATSLTIYTLNNPSEKYLLKLNNISQNLVYTFMKAQHLQDRGTQSDKDFTFVFDKQFSVLENLLQESAASTTKFNKVDSVKQALQNISSQTKNFQNLSKLFKKHLSILHSECSVQINFQFIFSCLEHILMSDLSLINLETRKSNPEMSLLVNLQISKHYKQFSLLSKKIVLDLIKEICHTFDTSVAPYLEWILNSFYFTLINFSSFTDILLHLNDSVIELIKTFKSGIFEYATSFIYYQGFTYQTIISGIPFVLSLLQSGRKLKGFTETVTKNQKGKKKQHKQLSLGLIPKETEVTKKMENEKEFVRFFTSSLKIFSVYLKYCGDLATNQDLIEKNNQLINLLISSNLKKFLELSEQIKIYLLEICGHILFQSSVSYNECLYYNQLNYFLNAVNHMESNSNIKEKCQNILSTWEIRTNNRRLANIQNLSYFDLTKYLNSKNQRQNEYEEQEIELEQENTKQHKNPQHQQQQEQIQKQIQVEPITSSKQTIFTNDIYIQQNDNKQQTNTSIKQLLVDNQINLVSQQDNIQETYNLVNRIEVQDIQVGNASLDDLKNFVENKEKNNEKEYKANQSKIHENNKGNNILNDLPEDEGEFELNIEDDPE